MFPKQSCVADNCRWWQECMRACVRVCVLPLARACVATRACALHLPCSRNTTRVLHTRTSVRACFNSTVQRPSPVLHNNSLSTYHLLPEWCVCVSKFVYVCVCVWEREREREREREQTHLSIRGIIDRLAVAVCCRFPPLKILNLF